MKKMLIFILGISLLAFGTSLCNLTGLGIDPFNAFCVAISDIFNIQLGTVILSIQAMLGILVFFLKRENIGVGTIIPILTFGYFLQFFNWFLPKIFLLTPNFIFNILTFIVGMLIIAFGMTVYMECRIGMVPYDSIAFVLQKYMNGKVAIFRIILDSTIALIAFFMGGPINIGTILLALSIGPLVDVYKTKILRRTST